MAFIERFTSKNNIIPYRGYIDENEFKEVFGTVEKAREYAFSIVKKHKDLFKNRDYIIIALYGLENKKIAEIFSYKVMGKNWPGNTEILAYIFKNGKHLPSESWSCENMDIVRGEEGKYRRKTSSLEEFLKSVPHLGDLQPLNDA